MTSPTPSPARLEELEKIAREADEASGDNGHCGEGTFEFRQRRNHQMAASRAFAAAFTPLECLELLALIRAQAEKIAELEGGGEALAASRKLSPQPTAGKEQEERS